MSVTSHPGAWEPGAWSDATEPTRGGGVRWGGSLALALGAHAAAALAVVAWHVPLTPLAADPPAILLELAPLPVAPPEPTPAMELPPQPPPPEPVVEPPPPDPIVEPPPPEPPPPEPVVEPPPPPEPPPVVEPEVVLPKPPPDPPKPKPEPKKEPPKPEKPKADKPKPRPVSTVPPTAVPVAAPAPAPAPVAAAPAPAAAPSRAVPSWQGRVLSHLERHKRYPRAAQARRQEGVAQVRFTIDREGRVLAVKLDRSAGHDLLDEETLEMVRRASPLPPPPDEMTQERIELVVPVQFFLK